MKRFLINLHAHDIKEAIKTIDDGVLEALIDIYLDFEGHAESSEKTLFCEKNKSK